MQINRIEESTVAAAARAQRGVGVSLRAVGKSYGNKTVLSGIDLELAPGEFVAVIGRSGCGKSTLLRTIASLEANDTGAIQIGAIGNQADLRIMFQEARLLPWKSVLDNVALGLKDGRASAWHSRPGQPGCRVAHRALGRSAPACCAGAGAGA